MKRCIVGSRSDDNVFRKKQCERQRFLHFCPNFIFLSRFPFSNKLALNAHNPIRCFVATANDIYTILALSSPTEKLNPGILQNASPQYFVAALECLLVTGFRDSCSCEFRHGSPISEKRV